jgi:hypothetical protein
MTLAIAFRSSSSVTVTCDFVQLTFADEGCYRYMTFVSNSTMALDVNDLIVDDGIEEIAYVDSTVTIIGHVPVIVTRGSPIYVTPYTGRQKLRFLIDGTSPSVDWTFGITVKCRLRTLTPV